MEWLLGIAVVLYFLARLVEKLTAFLKQLKSSGSAKPNKGFEAKLSIIPIDEKSEDIHKYPHI